MGMKEKKRWMEEEGDGLLEDMEKMKGKMSQEEYDDMEKKFKRVMKGDDMEFDEDSKQKVRDSMGEETADRMTRKAKDYGYRTKDMTEKAKEWMKKHEDDDWKKDNMDGDDMKSDSKDQFWEM